MEESDAVVIGAGPAGLAVAACLIRRGLRPLVLERAGELGASWRTHYERLHLHTVKTHSALPGLPFPAAAPRYVSRQGVVDYLEAYAAHHRIAPRLNTAVESIVPRDGRWQVATLDRQRFEAPAVVVATGANNRPNRPEFSGRSSFRGRIVHSGDYRNAKPFAGSRVLVVGMGNTGAEIALDLAEHGATASLSVRSPVNIVYRDVLGRPTQLTSMALARLPQRWGDAIARWLCTVTVGDIGRYGLRRSPLSPLRQLREQGRTPVIDIGTLARIKSGQIRVHPDIERFTADGVRFVDGSEAPFDAVVLATGYRAGVERLFPETEVPLDANGVPVDVIGRGALRGVCFVGFDLRQPGGLLRTIGLQAQQVAAAIASSAAGRPAALSVDPLPVRR
jgi:cation diffusion facilitator CzcD-associated flavoprotein CzcO